MSRISIQVLYSSVTLSESRLFKTCNSILSQNLIDKIFIIGYWKEGLQEEQHINNNITVLRLVTLIRKRKFVNVAIRKFVALLSFIQYHFKVVKACKKIKPDYISCHNLVLLPLCVLVKARTGAKLLYEPHELETERTGMGTIHKKIASFVESVFIKSAYKIVTVCEPITDFYIKKYKLDPNLIYTVQNVPINPLLSKKYVKTDILREEFDIPQDSIIYIYQGLIDKYRGIINYLETFSRLDGRYHLVLMGYGEDEKLVTEFEAKFSNIHFKKAVPVNEIIKYTSSADVGLFIIPGQLSLSYRYALPNKFYEYSIAGLYICVSDNFEYLTKIVQQHALGNVICNADNCLYDWIVNGNFTREKLKPNEQSSQFRENVGWQNEEKKYLEIYR